MQHASRSAYWKRPACLVAILLVAGCAGGKAGDGEAGGDSATDTKTALTDIGADIGCGVATLIGKDCARGAEVGLNVMDKFVSWVFRSLKIADAKTVNSEYKARQIPVAQKDVAPMAFTTNVQTKEIATEEGGAKKKAPQTTEVRVTSTSDLVGYGDKVPTVTQHYALYDEKNKLVSSKTERVAAVDGAGRYETDARFKVANPTGKKQYRVETTLVVDGKSYKKNTYKVAIDSQGIPLLARLEPVS